VDKGKQSSRQNNFKEMEEKLSLIQGQMESTLVKEADFRKETEIFKTLHTNLRREEEYWRLKSKNNWLKAGDRNTKLFHKQSKFRESKNNITHINHAEETIETFEKIKGASVGNYEKLYTRYHTSDLDIKYLFLEGILVMVMEEMNSALISPLR